MKHLAFIVLVGVSCATVAPAQAARPVTGSPSVDGPRLSPKGEQVAAKRGCGSRGGPGYRKANGKCASWR